MFAGEVLASEFPPEAGAFDFGAAAAVPVLSWLPVLLVPPVLPALSTCALRADGAAAVCGAALGAAEGGV
ncbi:hypothetical protein DY245_04795, partial [Streptomyces inhibens]